MPIPKELRDRVLKGDRLAIIELFTDFDVRIEELPSVVRP
jgi:hypothetical protein